MYNNNVMMTLLNTGVQLICIFILASRGNKEHMHHYSASHSFSSP